MRARDLDFLLEYRFHLFDISPVLGVPPLALNPGIGFAAMTAPELVMDKGTITPGNAYYTHTYVKRARISTITLSRGATLQDSDFWRWWIACLTGATGGGLDMAGNRRNLLAVHFSTKDANGALSDFASRAARQGETLSQAGSLATFANLPSFSLLGQIASRAWVLYDSQPSRYKAASDFNAKGSEVSIRELSIDVSDIDEIELSF